MQSSTNLQDGTSAVEDLPPGTKLVFKILQYEGKLTQQEIADETLLTPRTVRRGIRRLREKGIVESQRSPVNASKTVYCLSESTQHQDRDSERAARNQG